MPFEQIINMFFENLIISVFILVIAGSYTPVALCLIKGWQGILVLIIEWGAVLGGILLKSIATRSFPKLSMTIYMIMGGLLFSLFLP